jgi:hypothetical protein
MCSEMMEWAFATQEVIALSQALPATQNPKAPAAARVIVGTVGIFLSDVKQGKSMSERPRYTIENLRSPQGNSGRLREIKVHPYGRGCSNVGETADQMAARLLVELAVIKATPHQARSKKQN